ncbi:MAG: hypothetical protein M5U26_23125 [Planctomycetota bacterium]|nr:hypothetical protein [Planctomycetota bacterium]
MAKNRRTITVGELREKLRTDPNSLTVDELKAAQLLHAMRRQPPDESQAAWLVGRKKAAELLGVSLKRLDEVLGSGRLAKAERGRIHVFEVCRYLREERDGRRRRVDELTAARKQLDREGARYRKLKADLAQMELEIRVGNFVRSKVVKEKHERAMFIFREIVGELRRDLPGRLEGAGLRDCSAILARNLDGMLFEYAKRLMQEAEKAGASA